jgi:hypothetical protein
MADEYKSVKPRSSKSRLETQMTMPTYDNNWDDLYHEATKSMTPREHDTFLHGLIGAMSPFLDKETTERCIRIALTIHQQDLHLVKR